MTQKGSRKTIRRWEDTEILFHLATKGPTYSIDLEKPKNTILGDITVTSHKDEHHRPIPHGSLVKILQEFSRDGIIEKVPTTRKSRQGLIMPCYMITFIGLKRLLSIFKEDELLIGLKNVNDIFTSSQQLIPWISTTWNELTKLYDEFSMFDMFFSLLEDIETPNKTEQLTKNHKTYIRWWERKQVQHNTSKPLNAGFHHPSVHEEVSHNYKNVNDHIGNRLTLNFIHWLITDSITKPPHSIVKQKKSNSVIKLLHLIKKSNLFKEYCDDLKNKQKIQYKETLTLEKINKTVTRMNRRPIF